MSKILITMGGEETGWTRHNEEGVFRDYSAEAKRLMESGKQYFDKTFIYGHDFILGEEFYPKHKDVLDKVSFGFAFKSMCLYDALSKAKDGDIVFFADSNHIIDKEPYLFFELAEKNGVFARDHIWTKYPNREWTRRNTFYNMGCDEERYWNSLQMQCNVVGFYKNEFTLSFAKEWRDSSLNHSIMFGTGNLADFPEIKHHRHDQSIFSILIEKYKIPYLNRTENIWNEYIIPEIDYIQEKNPKDFSFRRVSDLENNK